MRDLRDHEAHSWLLRHQGSAGERAKNEATVSLVTSRYPGTNSDVAAVVVMAAPPSTAGSRSPGTTRIASVWRVVAADSPQSGTFRLCCIGRERDVLDWTRARGPTDSHLRVARGG